jgi:hypothetical protein
MAECDRECVAAAHQDAFDQRLAAVVEAGHGRILASDRREAAVVAASVAKDGVGGDRGTLPEPPGSRS